MVVKYRLGFGKLAVKMQSSPVMQQEFFVNQFHV